MNSKPAGTAQQTQPEHEIDPHRISQRQKQIDFGKNTVGYQRYRQAVPKYVDRSSNHTKHTNSRTHLKCTHCREQRRRGHPHTPDVHQKTSKRAFDGQVKKWRRALHAWDIPTEQHETDESKNQQGALQTQQQRGLPLKIPSAMRPTTKRSRTQHQGQQQQEAGMLTSPTSRPPPAKHAKTWADTVKARMTMPALCSSNGKDSSSLGQGVLGKHAAGLMMKWKEMKKEQPRGGIAREEKGLFAVGVAEEVCYSEDDDDDGMDEMPMPMVVV